jgi:hypothetical protein
LPVIRGCRPWDIILDIGIMAGVSTVATAAITIDGMAPETFMAASAFADLASVSILAGRPRPTRIGASDSPHQ